jgi:glycosyltransferase involved in cell wall biosynthesis
MLLENNPYPQDGRVRREAATLTEAGYQVSVICPAAPGQNRTETLNGVRVYRYPAPPGGRGAIGYLLEYGYSLLAATVISVYLAVRRGFDVIHAHNPPDLFVLLGGGFKLIGKRFVFDHHDLAPEMYLARFGKPPDAAGLAHRLLRFFERLSFRTADHVITTNESYRAIALARGGIAADRVTVVRNGPDLSRVRLVAPDDELRAQAPSIIGYVGEMGFQDGIDYLLRALHHLKVDLGLGAFYVVLMGGGDAVPELRRMCADLGLDGHVRFTGHVSDDTILMRYLSTADICVSPDPSNAYNDRSTMIKIGEYLALGKPVVAFDLPEHRVTAGEAAVYATPNNELDFAEKLAGLMDDPERRKHMGEIGRARVANQLGWEHQASSLVAAYESLGAPGANQERRSGS